MRDATVSVDEAPIHARRRHGAPTRGVRSVLDNEASDLTVILDRIDEAIGQHLLRLSRFTGHPTSSDRRPWLTSG